MGSGLVLSSTLSREALVGREEPSSRLDVIVRPLYIMPHAPDGSPIGRVLRVLLLKEDGRDAEGAACSLFASGEGEEATDGIEVACGAGHTEVALQSIVGETGVLIGLGGVYVGTALGEMQGCLLIPSLLGERL